MFLSLFFLINYFTPPCDTNAGERRVLDSVRRDNIREGSLRSALACFELMSMGVEKQIKRSRATIVRDKPVLVPARSKLYRHARVKRLTSVKCLPAKNRRPAEANFAMSEIRFTKQSGSSV